MLNTRSRADVSAVMSTVQTEPCKARVRQICSLLERPAHAGHAENAPAAGNRRAVGVFFDPSKVDPRSPVLGRRNRVEVKP